MDTTTKQSTFMAACREFFGQREGQSAMQFGQELMKLTREDKIEIREGFVKLGMNVAEIA